MSEGVPAGEPARSARALPTRGAWWLLGLLTAILVLLSFGGDEWRLMLRYERARWLAEPWRLVTGHLVHGTTQHLLLNAAGLAVVAALFARAYTVAQWLLIGVASAVVIDLGFVFFEPQLEWYVGLSGVLHGALAAGALSWWRDESLPAALGLSAILAGKLAWEQWQGALPLSGDLPVVVDAHLYGAVGGALAAGLLLWRRRLDWRRGPRWL